MKMLIVLALGLLFLVMRSRAFAETGSTHLTGEKKIFAALKEAVDHDDLHQKSYELWSKLYLIQLGKNSCEYAKTDEKSFKECSNKLESMTQNADEKNPSVHDKLLQAPETLCAHAGAMKEDCLSSARHSLEKLQATNPQKTSNLTNYRSNVDQVKNLFKTSNQTNAAKSSVR